MNYNSKKSSAIKSATATSIASLFAASAADATVVYQTAGFVVDDSNLTFSWNIDGTGPAEATFESYGTNGIDLFANSNSFQAVTDNSSTGLVNLNPGFNVGATLSTYAFNKTAFSIVNSIGGYNIVGFTNGTPGFIGFSFNPGGTTLYGWAEFTFDALATRGQITVGSWAYDDSGAGIAVGAIPESETAALALGTLALGAAGLRRMRRNKNSANV